MLVDHFWKQLVLLAREFLLMARTKRPCCCCLDRLSLTDVFFSSFPVHQNVQPDSLMFHKKMNKLNTWRSCSSSFTINLNNIKTLTDIWRCNYDGELPVKCRTMFIFIRIFRRWRWWVENVPLHILLCNSWLSWRAGRTIVKGELRMKWTSSGKLFYWVWKCE